MFRPPAPPCPHHPSGYLRSQTPLAHGASHPQHRLAFKGKGGDLFAVLIVNWLLTMVTLGLYYPWAKVRRLKYYYEHTELDGHPFHFHGTGREMFIGFIKAVGLLVLLYGAFFGLAMLQEAWASVLGFLVLFGGLLLLLPLIIHGTYRYRMSRSSWRGIHFGYRGDRNELYRICLRDGLLTLVTLGIYGSWFTINLRNYVMSHVRWGSSQFAYKGDGLSLFPDEPEGLLPHLVHSGHLRASAEKDLFHYYVDHLSWTFSDGRRLQFKGTSTGGGFFGLIITNVLW